MTALWPDLGDEHPHQGALNSTYNYIVTDRRLHLDTGQWKPMPASTTRPLLRVVCTGRHRRMADHMLAELWTTEGGLFFISKLPGALFDPPNDPHDPFAAPTAVLPPRLKAERRRLAGRPSPADGWQPVPVTIVRLFLDSEVTKAALLWVKCSDYGPSVVDRQKLTDAYHEDKRQRRQRDTPEATVIGLHDVRAVFSC